MHLSAQARKRKSGGVRVRDGEGDVARTGALLPRAEDEGGDAEADRDLADTELLNKRRDILWNNILDPLKELLVS